MLNLSRNANCQLEMFILIIGILFQCSLSQKRYGFRLSEECPNGTLVTRISTNRLYYQDSYSKTTKDTYQLLSASDLFSVDKETGDISTISRIDRESICPSDYATEKDGKEVFYENPVSFSVQSSNCKVSLQILRMSKSEIDNVSKTDVILIDIFIIDINDNPPKWQDQLLNITVPEHSPIDYRIPLPVAHDPDWGPQNTTSRYYLVEDSNMDSSLMQAFKLEVKEIYPTDNQVNMWNSNSISSSSWQRRKFKLMLRVDKDLDHENPLDPWNKMSKASFKPKQLFLKLFAEDEGQPFPLHSFIKLNITIADINDQAPIFLPISDQKKNVELDLLENTPIDRVVYQPEVFDPDPSDAEKLRFKFENSILKQARDTFKIDPLTGKVSVQNPPDYESCKEYLLPIVVSDGEHETHQNVLIRILNENDHEPKITVQSIFDEAREQSTPGTVKQIVLFLLEHQPKGTLIGTVSVEDADQNDFDKLKITCRMMHDNFALEPLFENAKNQFKLITKVSFDRELASEQFTSLICQDNESNSKTAQINMKVIIQDINDHGPIFNNQPMQAMIKENSPIGTWIYKVKARDSDTGINSKLGYSIDAESSRYFSIDPDHGDITSLRLFDTEEQNNYDIYVTVVDRFDSGKLSGDEYSKSSNSTLSIKIEDVNDCEPQFTQPVFPFYVSEEAKFNEKIGQVFAFDRDATDKNNQVRYAMKSDPDNRATNDFRVSTNGEIFVKSTRLDREKYSNYSFTVIAKDNGSPAHTSTTQVHIYITDVNDNAPYWKFPGEIAQSVNLSINEPNGFLIAELSATDLDEGENGTISYTLNKVNFIPLRRIQKIESSNKTEDSTGQQHNSLSINEDGIFELDSSGKLYVIRQLTMNDLGTAKLYVEATDKGIPPKVSQSILTVHIIKEKAFNPVEIGYGSQKSLLNLSKDGRLENDLIVIVIMVAVTLIISLILIVAILFLRCRYCIGFGTNNHINHRNLPLHVQQQLITQANHSEEVFRDSPRDFVLSTDLMNDSVLVDYGNNTVIRGGIVQSPSGDLWYATEDRPNNNTNSLLKNKFEESDYCKLSKNGKSNTAKPGLLWPKVLFNRNSFNRPALQNNLNNNPNGILNTPPNRLLNGGTEYKSFNIKSATIARQSLNNKINNSRSRDISNESSPIAELTYPNGNNIKLQNFSANQINKNELILSNNGRNSRNRILDERENETSIDSDSNTNPSNNISGLLTDDRNLESTYLKLNNNNPENQLQQNKFNFSWQNQNQFTTFQKETNDLVNRARARSKSRQDNRETFGVSWMDEQTDINQDKPELKPGNIDGIANLIPVHQFRQSNSSAIYTKLNLSNSNLNSNPPQDQHELPRDNSNNDQSIYNKFPTSFV